MKSVLVIRDGKPTSLADPHLWAKELKNNYASTWKDGKPAGIEATGAFLNGSSNYWGFVCEVDDQEILEAVATIKPTM